jgi:hypothetical protein
MKKLTLSLVAILLMAGLFQRCITNDEVDVQGSDKIQFSFSLDTPGESILALPDGASLLVSIERPDGESLFVSEPVKFEFSAGRYITEPLKIGAGHFEVTEFLIVDNDLNILAAVPLAGSQLDGVVKHSLSNTLVAERNVTSRIEMDLIAVENHKPESFGLKSFKAHKRSSFQMAVYIEEDGKKSFTDATGYITSADDTIDVYELKPRVNHLIFTGDPQEEYTLTIVKSGYETYTRQFKYSDLKKELKGRPLKITLEPASTSEARLKGFELNNRSYQFYYNASGGVDSIVATEGTIHYKYVVEYTNGRISKVSTIDGGVLVSTHEDFQYNADGRLVYYKYVYPEAPEYPVPYTITYDAQGNKVSINDQTYEYDDQHNVISGFGATFTYDTGLNPLYSIENVFAMFVEEPAYWSLMFSQHNATSRTAGGSTVYYTNQYDTDGKLTLIQTIQNGTVISEIPFYYYE